MNGLQIVGFDFWYFYTNDKWQYPLVNEQFAIWKSHEKAMVSAVSLDNDLRHPETPNSSAFSSSESSSASSKALAKGD